VKAKSWMSVRAAITALRESDSMSDLLRRCVAFSGDVDTVAAIALAAGSCCDELAQDLPDQLVCQLESGPYGRDYLADLDKRLLALIPR
jgi:ADP-ribosylglycohydrolase